jgi:hypothetical protein
MPTTPQHQYLANWHDSFVDYIKSLLGVVAGLMAWPEATEEDKRGLGDITLILNGRDAADVEHDLAAGVVKKSTLDKIEKLNKDLADTSLEHIHMNPLVREFWKHMAHIKIEKDKADERQRLDALHIQVF